METVEAGQHKESRAVDTRVQRQTKQLIRLVILSSLQEQEDDGQANGYSEPRFEFLNVALRQSSVRELTGHARSKKNDSVPQREPCIPCLRIRK